MRNPPGAATSPPSDISNAVLLVNPSHAHEFEQAFWQNFVDQSRAQGWRVVDLNFRKVPPPSGAESFIYPARLRDLSRRLASFSTMPLPPWASDDQIDLQVDWELRRWELNEYDASIRRGCVALCAFIDHVIRRLNPIAIITTNKIDHSNRFAYLAAQHYGISYRLAERSPLDTYLFERTGMFAESGRNDALKAIRAAQDDISSADRLAVAAELNRGILASPYGFRESEATPERKAPQRGDRPLFFMPLDNLLWTGWAQPAHPQGEIDYPVLRDPEAALKLIHRTVKALGGDLLIKPHPACREWPRIQQAAPELRFTEGDLDRLCDAAAVIVTFLTKVSYLGLAKGKPVVSFGTGLLDGLDITYEARSATDLRPTLEAALARDEIEQRVARFLDCLPDLAGTFFASGAEAARTLEGELADANVRAGRDVTTDEIRGLMTGTPTATPGGGTPRRGSRIAPTTVIFDVSRLLNERLERTGISRYARNVARGLVNGADGRWDVRFSVVPGPSTFGAHYERVRQELGRDITPLRAAIAAAESEHRPYLYHTPLGPLPPPDRFASGQRVITVHDILHLTMPIYDPAGHITPRVVGSIDLRRDATIFDSNYSMQEFKEAVGDEAELRKVIYLAADQAFDGPDPGALRPAVRTWLGEARYITFLCQADLRKEVGRMVRVASSWAGGDRGERRVVAVGAIDGLASFEAEIAAVPAALRDRFMFLSAPDDRELAALHSTAVAHLYLSKGEGFGLPPLESMRAGCPPIMLGNTSLGEVFKGWPLTLASDAGDDVIVGLLETLANDVAYDERLREAARTFSSAFSWDRHLDELTEFYEAVLDRPSNAVSHRDGSAPDQSGMPAPSGAEIDASQPGYLLVDDPQPRAGAGPIGRRRRTRARSLNRGVGIARRTLADLWRGRAWIAPALGWVATFAVLGFVPALASIQLPIWIVAGISALLFAGAYVVTRVHRSVKKLVRVTARLRRGRAAAKRRANQMARTLAQFDGAVRRLSEQRAELTTQVSSLQRTTYQREQALRAAIQQASATVEATGASLATRIDDVDRRLVEGGDAAAATGVALATRFDDVDRRLVEIGDAAATQSDDLRRLRERIATGERQIGDLRYPDASRCLVFFGHHKCASRFFRFEVFAQIAEMTGARVRRYVIREPPFHYSRMDDLDLMNIDFSDLGIATRDVVLFANATERSLKRITRAASDWRGVRAIRDPRQVLVSDYFHHRGDHPTEPNWVWDTLVRDQPLLRELPEEEGLLHELDHISREVIETQILARLDDPRILTIKVEDLSNDPRGSLTSIAQFLKVPDIAGIDLSRRYAGPDSGPWQEHLTPKIRKVFKKRYGQALIDLGYERDLDW